MRVLAIGECMAELAPAQAPDAYRLGFAGDTFNTAWYLARLGDDIAVSYFTAIGDDAISAQMRAFFRDSGIDDGLVQVVPGRTIGLYLISLADGERSFSYWRGQSAARELARDAAALAAAMETADLIYFSGITLSILAPSARAILLAALGRARDAGKAIAFDPNLRRRLWSDSAEMKATIMQGAAISDIALPSFADEATWFGDADPAATAARYANAGATRIVVKNGADPVYFLEHGESGSVEVPPLSHIVDTTAAGDSFNAAILAGLRDDTPLAKTIPDACRVAGAVVQERGALVPVFPEVDEGRW